MRQRETRVGTGSPSQSTFPEMHSDSSVSKNIKQVFKLKVSFSLEPARAPAHLFKWKQHDLQFFNQSLLISGLGCVELFLLSKIRTQIHFKKKKKKFLTEATHTHTPTHSHISFQWSHFTHSLKHECKFLRTSCLLTRLSPALPFRHTPS